MCMSCNKNILNQTKFGRARTTPRLDPDENWVDAPFPGLSNERGLPWLANKYIPSCLNMICRVHVDDVQIHLSPFSIVPLCPL